MPEESASPDLAELTRQTFQAWREAPPVSVADAWTSTYAPQVVWESAGLGTTLEVWASSYEEYEERG